MSALKLQFHGSLLNSSMRILHRSSRVTFTASGKNDAHYTSVIQKAADFAAKSIVLPANTQGEENSKVRVIVAIMEDGTMAVYTALALPLSQDIKFLVALEFQPARCFGLNPKKYTVTPRSDGK